MVIIIVILLLLLLSLLLLLLFLFWLKPGALWGCGTLHFIFFFIYNNNIHKNIKEIKIHTTVRNNNI